MKSSWRIYYACDIRSWDNRLRILAVRRALEKSGIPFVTRIRTTGDTDASQLKEAIDGTRYQTILATTPLAPEIARLLERSPKPVVLMGCEENPLTPSPGTSIHHVRTDLSSVAELAADHLTHLGHIGTYAFIHSAVHPRASLCLFKAYAKALATRGLVAHAVTSCSDLMGFPRPLALLTADDDTSLDAANALWRAGLRLPGDAFVLSVGNDEIICADDLPGISSVSPDYDSEGLAAGNLLVSIFSSSRRLSPQTVDVPALKVFARMTTDNQRSHAHRAEQIASCLKSGNLRGLSVTSVARYTGYSRSIAERAFRETYGVSLAKRIAELRFQEVKNLLSTTRLPMDEIADRCGYANPNYLKNLFKRKTGLTMSDWRRQQAVMTRL